MMRAAFPFLCAIVLAALAAAAGVGSLCLAQEAPAAPEAAIADSSATTTAHRVLAYYFHTTQRCASCRKIEAYTAEAITTGFVEEIKDGRLVFQAINIDEPENEHFVKEYQLYTKSVILVDEQRGKEAAWKNLPKVWQLLGDKEEFVRYIQEETRAVLSGTQS